MIVSLENLTVELSDPEVYVDNKKRDRSGHMTHAMTEFAPGTYINFNSSCSPTRLYGHSAYGFVEYRIARDYGRSYSEAKVLPFSWDALMDGLFTVSVEKAVTCRDGSILAFCLRNTMLREVCCEPWLTPMAVRSRDGGETWEAPFEVSPYAGRIYDAITVDGKIFFLMPRYNDFPGEGPDCEYSLFTSDDDGASFYELSQLPMDGQGRGYGSLLYDPERKLLHGYTYNTQDETHMDHAVSHDLGKTWVLEEPCFLNSGSRNPQTAIIDGVFVCHCRGLEAKGFYFYFSRDGYTWSQGFQAGDKQGGNYYSNNLLLEEPGDCRLLIQYSELVDDPTPERFSQVNVMHRTLRIK